MARERAIQIRVFQREYDLIKANADAAQMDLSAYVRAVAISPLSVGQMDDQPTYEEPGPDGIVEDVTKIDPRLAVGEVPPEYTKLVKQLEAQGKSPDEAASLARKRLGL